VGKAALLGRMPTNTLGPRSVLNAWRLGWGNRRHVGTARAFVPVQTDLRGARAPLPTLRKMRFAQTVEPLAPL